MCALTDYDETATQIAFLLSLIIYVHCIRYWLDVIVQWFRINLVTTTYAQQSHIGVIFNAVF